jgi:hypothetical protein
MRHLQDLENHLKTLSGNNNFEMNEIKKGTGTDMSVPSARTYKNRIEKMSKARESRIEEEARLANQS